MTATGPAGLDVDGVTLGFAGTPDALEPTSFGMAAGERVLVAGAAGSGKSVLLAAAAGVIPHLVRPARFAGTVRLGGVAHGDRLQAELFRRIGLVVQNLDDQLWDLACEDIIAFPLENRAVDRRRIRERIAALVDAFRIGHLRGRRVLTMSGGERRMVALASALATEPELMVLDEPTTGLDPAARRRLAEAVAGTVATLPMLLVAEQDPRPLAASLDRVLFQHRGRIAAALPAEAALASTECWRRIGLPPPRHDRPPRRAPAPGRAVLEVRGLRTRLRRADGRPVLDGIDVALQAGEVVGLVGPNGTGKTTLFKALLGLIPVEAGKVLLAGEAADAWTPARRARRIGYLPQDVGRLLFNLTVLDEVAFAVAGDPRRSRDPAVRGDAMACLAGVGLEHQAESSPFSLSARQQGLLGLACLEAAAGEVAILDEPLFARDLAGRARLDGFLDRRRGQGRAVILVSHDLELIDAVADRLVILGEGRVIEDTPIATGWRSPAFLALGWPAPIPATETIPA